MTILPSPLDLPISLRDLTIFEASLGEVRELCQKGHIIGASGAAGMPAFAHQFVTTPDEVALVANSCAMAVKTGRLIDFGLWTNAVIIYCSAKGGPLYNKGFTSLPFREPWLFVHRWQPREGVNSICAYLVIPIEPDLPGGRVQVVELNPVSIRNMKALMIADRGEFRPALGHQFECAVSPSPLRYLPGMEAINISGKTKKPIAPENAAASNVLDPLVTALLILGTRGIERETVFSEKLQKARAKSGKLPIPPYERVNSAPYVTHIKQRQRRGRRIDGGGTHASPIAHLRRGHVRIHLTAGPVFVRDAAINSDKTAFNRSHYAVR